MAREAETSPPAGPGAKAGARSRPLPPWGPIPGQQPDGVRHQRAQRLEPLGGGGPGDGPDVGQAGLAHAGPAELVDHPGHGLADRPAGGQLAVLDVGRAWVGGAHQREQARAALARRLDERGQRVAAQQRAHGQRVGAQALDLAEGRRASRRRTPARRPAPRCRCHRAWRRRSPPGRAARRRRITSRSAAHPGAPRRSKHATWGLTATHCSAAASSTSRQCAATARAARSAAARTGRGAVPPASSSASGQRRAGSGSSPRTICDRLRWTQPASLSPKPVVVWPENGVSVRGAAAAAAVCGPSATRLRAQWKAD